MKPNAPPMFNFYRRALFLPTMEEVSFVEKQWALFKQGKLTEEKWKKEMENFLSSAYPQKLNEEWWIPEGITEAFEQHIERLRKVKYLHKPIGIAYKYSWFDVKKNRKNMFTKTAVSKKDKSIRLEARTLPSDPHTIEAYMGNGVVQSFWAEEFKIIKRRGRK